MKTILVPTDFSDTAKNAAFYAFEFARQSGSNRIVLLNAYQTAMTVDPMTVDPTIPNLQLFGLDEIKRTSLDGLSHLKDDLFTREERTFEIEMISEFGTIIGAIEEVSRKIHPDLIVMGITGGDGLDVLIGSNTVRVAENTQVPVLIVPASCTYRPINNVLLVIDIKKYSPDSSLLPLNKILKDTHAKLHVLNIHEHDRNDGKPGNVPLNLPGEYDVEYHNIYGDNFSEAVNRFADSNAIDVIVTISKKPGFFDHIFRQNHTKQLAFHTHVPLLCLHDEPGA